MHEIELDISIISLKAFESKLSLLNIHRALTPDARRLIISREMRRLKKRNNWLIK